MRLRGFFLWTLPFLANAKIAFLFLTPGHLPLARTWHAFFDAAPANSFAIYVHASPGFVLNSTTVESPFFYDTQLPNSVVAAWCTASTVQAEIKLYAAALQARWDPNAAGGGGGGGAIGMKCPSSAILGNMPACLTRAFRGPQDPAVTWLVLLSDHCAPLRTFAFVQAYLATSPFSLIEAYDTTDQRTAAMFVSGAINASIIPRSAWRKGTQWATLNRRDAEVVVTDADGVTNELKRALNVAAADPGESCRPLDEHYKQIILRKAGRIGESSVGCMYLTFSGWHPIMYHSPDGFMDKTNLRVDQVFATLNESASKEFVVMRHAECIRSDPRTGWEHRWLYARKFSSAAAAQLWRDVLAVGGAGR